jgi:competence protein ComEC
MLKEFFKKIISSKSKTFLAFCFSFIIGAGAASLLDSKELLNKLLIIFFISLFLTIVCWSRKTIRFTLLCIAVLLGGIVRSLLIIPNDTPNLIHHYEGQKVEFHGVITQEPDVRIDKVYYVVRTDSVLVNKEENDVSGRVLVNYQLYPQFSYGDEVKVFCKLQKPKINDDDTFRYDKYLAKQDIWVFCTNPQVTKVGSDKGNFIFSNILKFKNLVARQLEKLWQEPENSFMAGILYGSKAGLPQKLMDNFSKTGVTHIIAVSGSNISIIAVNLMAVCIAIGLYRRKAFWVMVILIILFVIFTGASSSVVRAGIMGIIALIAERIGRPSRMTNVLVATAALMTLQNPLVLIWDAGFQLSFLATIGLVYISPLLKHYFENIKTFVVETRLIASLPGVGKIIDVTMENLMTTLSAIIATLPLILYQFGRLSTVAPLVNILILWTIPYLMLFGFLALIISFIYFPLGRLFAGIAKLGMDYILWIVNFFGSQNWSSINVQIPLWSMIVLYCILYVAVVMIKKKEKMK